MTNEEAAARVFPALLPGAPWETVEQFLTEQVEPLDKNDDGSICLKTMWGEDLNPNSHYYRLGFELGIDGPVERFIGLDNNSNASNT